MLTDSSFQFTEKNAGNRSLALCFGPPHSGISLGAGCLQVFGISLSEGRGGIDVQSINRILVQDLGGVPGQGSLLPKGWLESEPAHKARERIESSLSAHGDESFAFAADPELCRVLPLWLEVCRTKKIEPYLLHIVRHPYEVALALRKSQGMDLLQGHVLWLSYVRGAMEALNSQKSCLITFDQLLADPVSTLSSVFSSWDPSFSPLTSSYSSLLDYVQPGLKTHHAGSMSDQDKERFAPFVRFYDQLRRFQYEPGALVVDGADWELVDSVLAAGGQWEKKTASVHPQKQASLQERPGFSVAFPSANDEDMVISHELIPGQWQKVELTVPDPAILSQYPISIHLPTGQRTLQIASMQLEHEHNGRLIWKASTPQEFDVLDFNDHVHRVVDLNKA